MANAFRTPGEVAPPTPRDITPDMRGDAEVYGRFARVFGAIYLGVGGGLAVVFATLAALLLHQFVIGVVVGSIFFLAGALIRFMGVRQRERALRVFRDGVEAEARVVSVQIERQVRINGRSPFRVEYAFDVDRPAEVDRGTQSGSALVWDEPKVKPGDTVRVLYLRKKPASSVLWTSFRADAGARRLRVGGEVMRELEAAKLRVAELEAQAEAEAEARDPAFKAL